jgi:hypothetical protein
VHEREERERAPRALAAVRPAHPLPPLLRAAGNRVVAQLVMQRFGRQVDPDPQLVEVVRRYRNDQNYHEYGFARGEHNVAAAFNGNVITAMQHSNGGRHGEVNLDNAVGAAGRANVTGIFTEREPCVGCAGTITNNYITPGHLTENDVTWWAEYQTNKEKGKAALKDITYGAAEEKAVKNVGGSVSRSGRVSQPNPKYVS